MICKTVGTDRDITPYKQQGPSLCDHCTRKDCIASAEQAKAMNAWDRKLRQANLTDLERLVIKKRRRIHENEMKEERRQYAAS